MLRPEGLKQWTKKMTPDQCIRKEKGPVILVEIENARV